MKKHLWWIVLVLLIVGVTAIVRVQAQKPGKYDTFAQCIADSGAKFYGAWWCPHCLKQKAMFGKKSSKLLPYVECSTKQQKQTKECDDIGIKSYPTWIFSDNTTLTGEIELENLATKTSCPFTPLP